MTWHTWNTTELNETIRLAEMFSFDQIAQMKGYRSRQVISMALRKNNIRLHKKLRRKPRYNELLKYQVWEILTNRNLCFPQSIAALRLERFPAHVGEEVKGLYRMVIAERGNGRICKSLIKSGFGTDEIASFLNVSTIDVVEWIRSYKGTPDTSEEERIEEAFAEIKANTELRIINLLSLWWQS
ncbi:TPA: hypothetical protein ROA76_004375 [Escherichia coli]|nr:hypothetical protein [Escherichia coli]